jgi:hypothetical protein
MTVKLTVDTRQFSKMIGLAESQLTTIQDQAYKYFRDHTPYRSGNAQRNTIQRGDAIVAAYPYAGRLDTGYSRQAPDGMTNPTVDYIEKTLIPQAVGRINRGK